jgi:bifunctional DNA-binding transcriptional regulator/antitoxin component of YhaV-PrlF toxin-antitoxin module
MPVFTLTAKGQTTIPKEIREGLGLVATAKSHQEHLYFGSGA